MLYKSRWDAQYIDFFIDLARNRANTPAYKRLVYQDNVVKIELGEDNNLMRLTIWLKSGSAYYDPRHEGPDNPVLLVDPDGKVCRANAYWEHAMRYARDISAFLCGKPVISLPAKEESNLEG